MNATSGGALYRFNRDHALEGATEAHDSELPWPHCSPTLVVWRNGVGLPVKMIPGWIGPIAHNNCN